MSLEGNYFSSRPRRYSFLTVLLSSTIIFLSMNMIFPNNKSVAAEGQRVIAYVTWQNLSQRWNGGVGLFSEPSLDMLTDIIAPAVNPKTAGNPVIVGMYGENLESLKIIAEAGHKHGCLVGPYLYTDASGNHGPTLSQIISAGTINTLVKSIGDLLAKYDLDGITIDAEDGSSASTLNTVLQAMRAGLPSDKYIDITGRPYASPNISLDSARFVRNIHVMTYDMGWSPNTGGYPHSSLEASIAGMKMWSDAGFAKSKLIMGIPTYGRTAYVSTLNPKQESLQYRDVLTQINNADEIDHATLTGTSGLKRDFWWGSTITDRLKVRWNADNYYAGVMIFALGYDELNSSRSKVYAIFDELHNSDGSGQLKVVTDPASTITTTEVTLNGSVISIGTSSTATVGFEIGLTTDYGREVTCYPAILSTSGRFCAFIENLTPNTTYHFRATTIANDGTRVYGNDRYFTTKAVNILIVTTLAASNIMQNSATLNGQITDGNTGNAVSMIFEYGLTSQYEHIAHGIPSNSTEPLSFSADIDGLIPNTLYHFRAKSNGLNLVYGDDLTFKTSPPDSAISIATNALPPGQVGSVYHQVLQASGGTTPYTWSLKSGKLPDGLDLDSQNGVISGLPLSKNVYTFEIQLLDSHYPNSLSVSRKYSITVETLSQTNPQGSYFGENSGGNSDSVPKPKPPVMSTIEATNTTRISTDITWETDRECITEVTYSFDNREVSLSNDTASLEHIATLENLKPNTVYNVEVTSLDPLTSLAASDNIAFRTDFNPASFYIDKIKMNSNKVMIDQPLEITVDVKNTGDIAGQKEVVLAINSNNSTEIKSQIIDIGPGDSREICFIITEDCPGIFEVKIGEQTGTFIVGSKPTPCVTSFDVIPVFDEEKSVTSFILNYELSNPGTDPTDAELLVAVSSDERSLDTLTLFSGNIPSGKVVTGSFDYLPIDSPAEGKYSFNTQIYSSDSYSEGTVVNKIIMKPEKAVFISWSVLAIIIGLSIIAALITSGIILAKRQELLKIWSQERALARN